MTSRRNLLRARSEHGHSKVTFIELFFDLVFVFAVTQLSHSLIEHFTLLGAVQTLLLMLGMWWVWIYTSWVTNWLDPEKLPVRVLLLAMMLIGLILSASIPTAFESRGLAFAGAYVTMQGGRTLFFLWAVQGHRGMVRNFQRILVWLTLAGVFWIAGALAHDSARLALWATALGLEFVSPSLGFWVPGLGRSTTTDWNVEGGHLSERCALFIIIALGESILVTGATFAGLEWTPSNVAAFAASFLGSIAMWWLYFDTGAEFGSAVISRSGDPGRIARFAYTYIHLFMVAGIIVCAVADEFVLAHPTGHTDVKIAVSVLGGTALYLFGITIFKWTIGRRFPVSHLVAIASVALLTAAVTTVSPLTLSIATTLVLIALAAWERKAKHLCPEPQVVRE